MFSKIKTFLSAIKCFFVNRFWPLLIRVFTNLRATIILCIGIAIIVAGNVGALWMMPTAVLPVIFSFFSTFIGAFVLAGVLPHFIVKNSINEKLEKARAETKEEQRKNLELRDALRNAKMEQEKLLHRLNSSINVTGLQPVMKITPGELRFTTTDYYEKRLDSKEPYTHFVSRKRHEDPEFYRGICRYSARQNISVDLCKIKVAETDDAIVLYGPIEYETSTIDDETTWLMQRHEQESRHGDTDEDLETYEIKVNPTCDPKWKEEQIAEMKKNLKASVIEPMKPFLDSFVVEYIKLLLAPTGKSIIYHPTSDGVLSSLTLGKLITSSYNNKVAMPPQATLPIS